MIRILRLATPLLLAGLGLTAGPLLAANGRTTLAAGDGDGHVLVIGEGNTLWSWGANDAGQLGDGTTTMRLAPVRVGTTADWAYVAAGSAHSVAIKTDGSLWTWGANDFGQLGNGITATANVPTRIAANILGAGGVPARWVAVVARGNYSAGITEAGNLYVWGEYPDFRTVFTNLFAESKVPVRVGASTDVYFGVAAGYGHMLALRGPVGSTTGRLVGWGLNNYGQLGRGATSIREPVGEVLTAAGTTASDWSGLSAGTAGSFGVRGDSLYAWGGNLAGELGIVLADPFSPPLYPTLLGTGFTEVVAGTAHTLARKGDTLWGWGSNGNGELGIPLFNSSGQFIAGNDRRSVPTQLSPDAGYTAVAPGQGFSVALNGGIIISSGNNASGQLGIDSTVVSQYGFEAAAFGFPDLRITEVRTLPGNFVPGDTIVIEVDLANDGSGAVEVGSGAVVGVRLSVDPEWDAGSVTLNDNMPIVNRIGPGQTGTASATITIPGNLAAGDYFIVARADRTAVVAEINEDNNDGVSVSSYRFLPDLLVDSADITFAAGLDLNRQDPVTVTLRVSNAGQVNLPAGSGVQGLVVLTRDGVLGNADDVVLAPFTIAGAIPRLILGVPGESSDIVVTAPIPGSANPGDYFVGVMVDDANALLEMSKENNVTVRTGQTLRVSEASAIPLALAVDLNFSDFTDPFFNTPVPFVAPGVTFSGNASWFGIEADLPTDVPDGDVGRTPVLNSPGETATFGLELKGPMRVTFRWRLTSAADELQFSMDGAVQASIDGVEDWRSVDIIIPGANPPRRLEWTYVRNSTRAADPDAVGYLDNLTITGINEPDMVVSQLDYNAEQTEVFVIGRDTPLDIQIVGLNRGVPVPASSLPASNQFQVEVRLSRDQIWGNADDYVLGSLDEIQRLDSSQRFVYGRVIDLDDCAIVSGDYYLGVRVDSAGLYTEFDENNNVQWSAEADIRVEKRPQLRVTGLDYIPGLYYREQEILVEFNISNVGCEDIPPGVPVETQVRMVGLVYDFSITANAGLTINVLPQPLLTRTLVTINDDNGIKAGENAEFRASFQIPRYVDRDLFPIYHPAKPTFGPGDLIPRLPDFDIERDDTSNPKGFPLPLYGTDLGEERNPVFFFFEFESTAEIPLVEDIIIQTFGSLEIGLNTYFDTVYDGRGILILETPANETYSEWAGKYPLFAAAGVDSDGDGFSNFQEFAFISDPRFARFAGANASTQGTPLVGLVDIPILTEGQFVTFTFLSAAFNMLSQYANGDNLTYVVEFADDAGFTTNLTAITLPPTMDHHDLRELPGVVSATDNGYSYRVFVRDSVPSGTVTSRFGRVRVVTP